MKCLVMTKSKGHAQVKSSHAVLCLLKTPVCSINNEIVTVEMCKQDAILIAPLEYYSNSGTEVIVVSKIDCIVGHGRGRVKTT